MSFMQTAYMHSKYQARNTQGRGSRVYYRFYRRYCAVVLQNMSFSPSFHSRSTGPSLGRRRDVPNGYRMYICKPGGKQRVRGFVEEWFNCCEARFHWPLDILFVLLIDFGEAELPIHVASASASKPGCRRKPNTKNS